MNRVFLEGCPYGWSYRKGACYRVVNKDTPDWETAAQECLKLRAKIAKVTSDEENKFVLDLAKTFAPEMDKVWLSPYRDCDTGTLYNQDYTAITYNHCMEGQPDNHGGNENCGIMYLNGEHEGLWNDVQCHLPDNKIAYVCQKGMLFCFEVAASFFVCLFRSLNRRSMHDSVERVSKATELTTYLK